MLTVRRLALLSAIACSAVGAQEGIKLDAIYVKANKEFPQTLYVVPWNEVKGEEHKEQRLVLHSLYGDLFEPVTVLTGPEETNRFGPERPDLQH